jgi:hypothetical protein
MKNKKHNEEGSDLHEMAAAQLKNKNLVELSQKAKEKSMLLLEEPNSIS